MAIHDKGGYTEEDAALIVVARSALPKLIAELRDARIKLNQVRQLLGDNGCDCYCDHPEEDGHDGDCEPCLACRIASVVQR